MQNYIAQAEDFLTETGTHFEKVLITENANFDGDKPHWKRCKYVATFSRNGKTKSFDFTGRVWNCPNSTPIKTTYDFWKMRQIERRQDKEMIEAKKINAYDVLSCLTKNDVGSFNDFCSEFGYDTDSRKASDTYLAVQNEYDKVLLLWGDCLEKLQEIQ